MKKIDNQQIQGELENFITNTSNLKVAYDIKILSNGEEYNPNLYGEKLQVTINDIELENETEQKEYRVVHIGEENTKEVENVKKENKKITFSVDNFSVYAILEEIEPTLLTTYSATNSFNNAVIWDGNVASEFKFGDGTYETPYLITNGSELAYLAQEVNSGITFENEYFQLTNDINLNDNNWTPIGNTNNSFRGTFDGAGHVIGNARIIIDSIPTQIESYGFFGSLGGGNSKAIIKNTEIYNIKISIGGNGNLTSGGWHIGTLVGTIYKNSEIINNIARECSILDSGEVTLYEEEIQYSVGGLVGYATNTSNNTSDPGSSSRYKIENCFVNTKIELKNEARTTLLGMILGTDVYDALYHTGGIIGTIRSQPIWPENCLYLGEIDSNGYIGPIFGALQNQTSANSKRNYSVLWNGNDAGGSLSMNSYYSGFSANGTPFTTNITSGTSSSRLDSSYRNIGNVQGVNKGIYTSDISSRISSFNDYAGNEYMKWKYENGTFYLIPRFITSLNDSKMPIYSVDIDNQYSNGPYTYKWYLEGEIVDELENQNQVYQEFSWERDFNYTVLINDGEYYALLDFTISRLYIDFEINELNDSVTATVKGSALEFIDATKYTYQWYITDISGANDEKLENETTTLLENLEKGTEYKLVATYPDNYAYNLTGTFIYGKRNVIYVDYYNGNNGNDGFTPETAVETISAAYSKLDSNLSEKENIIVIINTYADNSFFNYDDESRYAETYQKNATITGRYNGIDYEGELYFYSGEYSYRYLNGNTNFQYLNLNGNNSQMYLYAQGYSVTIGEGIYMNNYADSNKNQGLLGQNAPAFHLICGWCQYNYTTLPRNNPKILINSGTYARIIGGGSPGTASGQGQENSHDFTGSSKQDSFNIEITIDIKNSTTSSEYDYDINLLTGGSACGNNYSNVVENIKSGSVGRVLGGSIGDSQTIPTVGGGIFGGGEPWSYPNNTFLGTATINLYGGEIAELYGGCLGRNMGAIYTDGSVNEGYNENKCDSYFYGTININIEGGTVLNNIYGAGAGGVTGYSENSSDPYKDYGKEFETSVNINIMGGTINGDVYGGGYGFTAYLNQNVTAEDGGSLYGDSTITLRNSPTINGNIYAAGCGYDYSERPNLAQMEGNTTIYIYDTPKINGEIFAAGAGLEQYPEMAKIIGNTTTNIYGTTDANIYGGGNNSKTEGNTIINIEDGTHTGDIYGGGNLGIVTGITNVNINGGNSNIVYGGGNQAEVSQTNVNINGGTVEEVYAGGNSANVSTTNTLINGGQTNILYGGSNKTGEVQNSTIEAIGGSINTLYGGNNLGGTTQNSLVKINGSTINSCAYGGGNNVNTTNASLYLISSGNNIPNIFAGGNNAAVDNPRIYIQGGQAQNIFGGSNSYGTINQSNVELTGGKIENVYGGGNQVGVQTTNVNLNGSEVENIYGGANISGNVTNSNVIVNSGYAKNIYGGNNQGGNVATTYLNILGGEVENVYGGGNQAITGETNLNINGIVTGDVYGGGNEAGIETNTNLNIENAQISNNVYGGGKNGIVEQNTIVQVKNSTIGQNIYSGGNGETAIVYGNTNLTIHGNSTTIGKNVFGGGNKAATGNGNEHNSISSVNIVSGEIGGNVYGGANTSVVYGVTKIYIGYDVIENANLLEKGNLNIKGTVFGGGEANASGSEDYDYSYISVTKGIEININGNGYNEFNIYGSIFGSGNASSTSGESYINIENYGTIDKPKSNISLQRATCITLLNSTITLSGATDRTNEFSDEYYTISRVDKLKMENNSTLYLNYGANLLKEICSILYQDGNEIKGKVTINEETGEITKNVDNRIYMAEGKNLNIATNENADAYGKVSGMFFLGLFTNKLNPSTSTGFYNYNYENGDEIINEGTFSYNSYVIAQHMTNHDTSIDGFYTNYNNEGYINVKYIETTPEDDVYYIWLVGEQMDVTSFEFTLTASKFATLGTYELSLLGFSDPNIVFNMSGFSSGLAQEVSLINPEDIEPIAEKEENANNKFGLQMETGKNGWTNKGETIFLTENGGMYEKTNTYIADNSVYTPTLTFCLLHSANITEEKLLGDVKIRLQALVPVDELNYDIKFIDINIILQTALYQDEFYEAAITPGEEYELFTSTTTNLTKKSAFSTYYSLYLPNFSENEYYNDYENDYRVLISRDENNNEYSFPENTRIVMLDLITNKEYYYVVTAEDEKNGKFEYELSKFVAMGSTDEYFKEKQTATENYYNSEKDILYENFIFHVKFSETNIAEDVKNNSLLIELRNEDKQTLIGVLGIQRDLIKYSIYNNKQSTINISAKLPETAYIGTKIDLEVTTEFVQPIENSTIIYDTEYFESKMGIIITIIDNNGEQVRLDSLFGVSFEIDNQKYYPRLDGTTRIKIADKVSNVLSKIKIDTTNNSTWATGTYTIKIETFGSPDGIYFGTDSSASTEQKITIINSSYGLNLTIKDEYKIIDSETTQNLENNNKIESTLEYSSGLENPQIVVALYRRNYEEIYSEDYELVNLRDYFTNILNETNKTNEYLLSTNPMEFIRVDWSLKNNLQTGTYKLVYKLYDNENYIGEDYEYFIIK